jgi:hypothetical protein
LTIDVSKAAAASPDPDDAQRITGRRGFDNTRPPRCRALCAAKAIDEAVSPLSSIRWSLMPRHVGATRTFEARMLALTDEVFQEFDDLPVLMVMRAITSSWSDLRGVPPTRPRPEAIVSLARHKLSAPSRDRRAEAAGVGATVTAQVDGALLDEDHGVLAQTSAL